MKQTLFTIVVPMYQSGNQIPRLLQSLRQQTESSFELLLLDDGSSDHTVACCRALTAGDERVHILPFEHRGFAGILRNIGIRNGSGEYIVFCDADDELEPDALTTWKNAVERNHHPDVIAGGVRSGRLNEVGVFISRNIVFNFSSADGIRNGKRALEELHLRHKTLHSYCYANIYKRKFLLTHQLFQREDIRLQEDHEWLPRVLFFAQTIAAVDQAHYHYIRSGNSITTALNDHALCDIANVMLELSDFAQKHQNDMSIPLLRFWSAHALNSFFWYFFHPLYAKRFSVEARKKELKHLFRNRETSQALSFLFRYSSRAKRLTRPLLFAAAFGWEAPAMWFFRFYYRNRI